MASKGWYQNK